MSREQHMQLLGTTRKQADRAGQFELIVKGQGVVAIVLDEREPFNWKILDPTYRDRSTAPGLMLQILPGQAALYERRVGDRAWYLLSVCNNEIVGLAPINPCRDPNLAANEHPCQYWISLDKNNRRICYGKGEIRPQTILLQYPEPNDGENDHWPEWAAEVNSISLSLPVRGVVWRDPVTVDPPLFVVPPDVVSMDDVALNRLTVPANLTDACQVLYDNVSGSNFKLNTPEFPHFTDAIEASIRDKDSWCHQKLEEKRHKPDGDIKGTYLRITMGVDQGDSPGVPYVMEIWPPGHYSSIHNHADANAIIRVLHGEITVKLFAMLSPSYQDYYIEQVFKNDDITWLAPGMNQTHQLVNRNESGPTCITIQCYRYGVGNTTHYEYFDYIDGDCIKPFTPKSDMGFLEFKALMAEEWAAKK